MKRLLLALLLMAIATPAHANVWIIVFAGEKEPIESPNSHCAEDPNTINDSITDKASCEAAGFAWVDENYAQKAARGDIISVKPGDVAGFGGAMCGNWPPADGGNIVCVEITDKDEAHAKNYVKKVLGSNLVEIEQSRFYVDITALPTATKITLNTTGELHKTWAQIKPFIMDKETGQVIP